jgi:hypothetical protein
MNPGVPSAAVQVQQDSLFSTFDQNLSCGIGVLL